MIPAGRCRYVASVTKPALITFGAGLCRYDGKSPSISLAKLENVGNWFRVRRGVTITALTRELWKLGGKSYFLPGVFLLKTPPFDLQNSLTFNVFAYYDFVAYVSLFRGIWILLVKSFIFINVRKSIRFECHFLGHPRCPGI